MSTKLCVYGIQLETYLFCIALQFNMPQLTTRNQPTHSLCDP